MNKYGLNRDLLRPVFQKYPFLINFCAVLLLLLSPVIMPFTTALAVYNADAQQRTLRNVKDLIVEQYQFLCYMAAFDINKH